MRITPLAVFAPLALCALTTATAAQGELPEGFVKAMRCPNEGLQPKVSVGKKDGLLHLVYFQGELAAGDLFYVRSEDDGESFSDPLRVNSQAGSVDAGGRGLRGGAVLADAEGSVHVAWVGSEATVEGDDASLRPLLYSRLAKSATAFEASRVLSGENAGLDVAPAMAERLGKLSVYWHAPGETLARVSEAEPGRRVYLARSEDGGGNFGAPVALGSGEFSVSAGCGIATGVGRNGLMSVIYTSRDKNLRDMRLLASADEGATFKDTYVDTKTKKKTPRDGVAATLCRRGVLVAWENQDKTWWALVDKDNGRTVVGISARQRKDVASERPAVIATQAGAVLLVWSESNGEGTANTIGWQGFDLMQRFQIGRGRFQNLPEGSYPAVFLRSEEAGVTIVY